MMILMCLSAVGVVPLAAAESVDSPTHECGGDVDHACIQCPAGSTYDDARCVDANGNNVPSTTCALYASGTCSG